MYKSYQSLAKYYDLFFQQKDYETESKFIINQIQRHSPNAKSILDVGCGTGVHLNMLQDRFETLHGVDLNAEIIEVAKEKSDKINYSVSGMADFNLSMKFDVITCLYSVFNYNLTDDEAIKTILNFNKHLAPEGLLIIALYKPTNTEKKISIHSGNKDDIEVAKINQYVTDPKTGIETSNFIIFTKDKGKVDFSVENDHKMKVFPLEHVSTMLQDNGFHNVMIYDKFTDKLASEDTTFPIYVATAK